MSRIQNILVPIDFTDTSRLILQQGARLASRSGSALHVLHVVEHGRLRHFESTHGKQDSAVIESRAREQLKRCLADAGLQDTAVNDTVVVGDPVDAILERIDELEIDLAVLSAHDTGKKRLGRVAAHVVRRAGCNVLIARDWQPGPFRRVAVCVDFSRLSPDVMRQAIDVATRDQASLEMIHVLYPLDLDYDVYKIDFGTKSEADYRAEAEARLRNEVDEFTAPFAADLEGLDFRTANLESADPAEAITTHLREHDFDLVVLGTTGREQWFGLRFGSNAERLVNDTHCSVLAVKPPQ